MPSVLDTTPQTRVTRSRFKGGGGTTKCKFRVGRCETHDVDLERRTIERTFKKKDGSRGLQRIPKQVCRVGEDRDKEGKQSSNVSGEINYLGEKKDTGVVMHDATHLTQSSNTLTADPEGGKLDRREDSTILDYF